MPKLEAPQQAEMFKGINYGLLKRIIDDGITAFGSLIYEYNRSVEPGREKIDALNNVAIQKIADFLRSEGKEKEAKKIENFFKKDNRPGELALLEEKPGSSFTTFAEKSQPKEAE